MTVFPQVGKTSMRRMGNTEKRSTKYQLCFKGDWFKFVMKETI